MDINFKEANFYKYYNAHPNNLKVQDCVVRAYCTALGKDYLEARKELNKAKRDLGLSSYKNKIFFDKYFKDKFKYESYKAEKGYHRLDGEMFASTHQKGNLLIKDGSSLNLLYRRNNLWYVGLFW